MVKIHTKEQVRNLSHFHTVYLGSNHLVLVPIFVQQYFSELDIYLEN